MHHETARRHGQLPTQGWAQFLCSQADAILALDRPTALGRSSQTSLCHRRTTRLHRSRSTPAVRPGGQDYTPRPSLGQGLAIPSLSQAVVDREPSVTIYVGGQNAITKDGQIAGDTIGEQVTQALINLELAQAAADATIDDVVHWTIWLVQGQDAREALGIFRQRYPELKNPPAISVPVIAALANRDRGTGASIVRYHTPQPSRNAVGLTCCMDE